MTIRVRFDGGPMHHLYGNVSDLPQCQLFFDVKQRQVFCYNRTDELVYSFEPEVSAALTKKYDEAFDRFGKGGASVQSWDKKKIEG